MLCQAPWQAAAHTVGSTESVDLGQFKAHYSLWFGSYRYPGAVWPKHGLSLGKGLREGGESLQESFVLESLHCF